MCCNVSPGPFLGRFCSGNSVVARKLIVERTAIYYDVHPLNTSIDQRARHASDMAHSNSYRQFHPGRFENFSWVHETQFNQWPSKDLCTYSRRTILFIMEKQHDLTRLGIMST